MTRNGLVSVGDEFFFGKGLALLRRKQNWTKECKFCKNKVVSSYTDFSSVAYIYAEIWNLIFIRTLLAQTQ